MFFLILYNTADVYRKIIRRWYLLFGLLRNFLKQEKCF
ncbi:hypothetical protein B4164_3671 [Bacillus licheniformis]|nr:hypothetical protein B4164_3671 [Bacillus licheniformis]